MQFIHQIINFILHIDVHLAEIMANYGTLTYCILFLIVFCETGLVVTPFLPGDSLLFAAGALVASTNVLNIWLLAAIVWIAAILGNISNYYIGKYVGPKIFEQQKIKLINKDYLIKTQQFYEKHGGKAIIISRFLPIFRTFVPFVAGIGNMNATRFMIYNVLGATFWAIPFTFTGYLFGEIPFVKNNFSLVVLAIIGVTALPALIEFGRQIIKKNKN